jgi:hypothetical protein
MVSTLIILAVAISALVMVWVLVYSNAQQALLTPGEWERKRREIDVQIFRSLVDCHEQRYLARSLSNHQFKVFQRQRIQLALRMARLAKENADMLVRFGAAARVKHDPVLAREADQLVAVATQFRLNLMRARLCLWIQWLFPGWSFAIPPIETQYRHMLNSLLRIQQHSWQP